MTHIFGVQCTQSPVHDSYLTISILVQHSHYNLLSAQKKKRFSDHTQYESRPNWTNQSSGILFLFYENYYSYKKVIGLWTNTIYYNYKCIENI